MPPPMATVTTTLVAKVVSAAACKTTMVGGGCGKHMNQPWLSEHVENHIENGHTHVEDNNSENDKRINSIRNIGIKCNISNYSNNKNISIEDQC